MAGHFHPIFAATSLPLLDDEYSPNQLKNSIYQKKKKKNQQQQTILWICVFE